MYCICFMIHRLHGISLYRLRFVFVRDMYVSATQFICSFTDCGYGFDPLFINCS